jgi:prophage regulatory protein
MTTKGKLLSTVAPQALKARRFIRLDAVMDITSLAVSTVYDKMASGDFPKPVKLFSGVTGKKSAVAWVEDEILAWMDARMAERDARPEKAAAPIEEPSGPEPEAPEAAPEPVSHKEQVLRDLERRAAAKRKPKVGKPKGKTVKAKVSEAAVA